MAKICLVGKYPPLQGGTAGRFLWLAYWLADAGHDVHVVTTGSIGGPAYVAHFRDDEWKRLEVLYPEFGRVKVHSLAAEDPTASFAIPDVAPLVTRLCNVATKVVKDEKCDFIVASYIEPYGVAAAFAARLTEVPYVFIHAGSDLGRLSLLGTRSEIYRRVFADAALVLSSRNGARSVLAMGVLPDNLLVDGIALSPPSMFSQPSSPLDLTELRRELEAEARPGFRVLGPTFPKAPILGTIGKLGRAKGTFDLLRSMAILRDRQMPVHLAMLTAQGGHAFHAARSLVAELKLEQLVTFVPYLPPWRVHEFVSLCDAVAFLENRFPIAIHRPQVPREVASSGVGLILSKEVAAYQSTREPLEDGRNVILVDDPTDHNIMARIIGEEIYDKARLHEIGDRARTLYEWPSLERVRAWTCGLVDQASGEAIRCKTEKMSREAFNKVLLRIYADRNYRAALVARGPQPHAKLGLSAREAETIRLVLHDNEALDRYCASLIDKKWRFLSRYFALVLEERGTVAAAVEVRFRQEWILTDAGVDADLLEFERLVAETIDVVERDGQHARTSAMAQLAGARARTRFKSCVEPSSGSELSKDSLIQLSAACELVAAPCSPCDSTTSSDGGWWAVVVPSQDVFDVRTFEISSIVHSILDRLRVPMSVAEATHDAVEPTNHERQIAARDALEQLWKAGVLEVITKV